MSGLIGAALPQFILARKDIRLHREGQPIEDARARMPHLHEACYEGWFSDYWPGNRGFLGDRSTDVALLTPTWRKLLRRITAGAASRVGFVGVTRDQFGAPVGGCVVQLFRTSDDLFIMEITSDASGNFLLQSWYSPDAHYIVAYKAGSPDIFGTTVNTLVGA
jgi:hypothetical protein